MKSSHFIIHLSLLGILSVGAQEIDFNALSGSNSATGSSIDGGIIADHYGGSSYTGYVGELTLIFANEEDVPGGIGVPRGSFLGDAGEAYAGKLGLVVFCTDSETGFNTSATSAQTFSYEAHNLDSAESRYLTEGVPGYRPGGLKRAAFLIERFYDEAHGAGDVEASALQAAIWEVLTDEVASLQTGSGNYYVRNNTSSGSLNDLSDEMIGLTDSWFSAAEAEGWGGAGYDPSDRVAFWMDPDDISNNQTVISLNPDAMNLVLVPEPGSATMVMISGGLLLLRRRRESLHAGSASREVAA